MPIAKPQHHNDTTHAADVNLSFGTAGGIEGQDYGDYELDDTLRQLQISRWFAIAEENDPFWAV